MEKGVKRWLVDISKWNPSPHSFSLAMSVLPQHEHSSITRFVKLEDRKRALVSRLLQYGLVHQVLGIPFDEIRIRRTVEGKPFLVYDQKHSEFPNFNFNTSHDGDYVAIASEPLCLVGIDVVACRSPTNQTIPEFIWNFSSYFSAFEWSRIFESRSCEEMLNQFLRYWCLKEAFVKAIGVGVGYRFDKIEFHHSEWSDISASIDGKELKDWRFWLYELDNGHFVSIARGHPKSATATYRYTLKVIELDREAYHLALHAPNISFSPQTMEQLVQIPSGAPAAGEELCHDQITDLLFWNSKHCPPLFHPTKLKI